MGRATSLTTHKVPGPTQGCQANSQLQKPSVSILPHLLSAPHLVSKGKLGLLPTGLSAPHLTGLSQGTVNSKLSLWICQSSHPSGLPASQMLICSTSASLTKCWSVAADEQWHNFPLRIACPGNTGVIIRVEMVFIPSSVDLNVLSTISGLNIPSKNYEDHSWTSLLKS